MCFILTAIKLKEDKNVENAIVDVMKNAQDHNSNGTGSICYQLKKTAKAIIKRDMVMTEAEMQNDIKAYDVISYHFRMATVGTVNVENVHWWKKGDWAFAHNGQIYDVGYNGKSDSLAFFEQIIKNNYLKANGKIHFEKIKEFTNTFNFWGRFILINTKTKNMYFFGDFHFYLLNRAYMVITSATADFEGKIWVNGIDFEVEDSIEVLDKEIEGIYMLNTIKGTFKQISDDFIIRINRTYNYKHTPKNQLASGQTTQSMGFETVGAINARSIEHSGEYLNRRDVELVAVEKLPKVRDEMSYIKEFYGRLSSHTKKHPAIEEAIWNEGQTGAYNEMGLTETEQFFWNKWIVPQIPKDAQLDFSFEKMNLTSV